MSHDAAALGLAAAAKASRFVAQPNEASIRAAAAAAIAAGGGTVVIQPGVIQVTQPLPVASGLAYEGQNVPSWLELSAALATGTVLVGDGVVNVSPGTFNCFEWNTADNAVIPYGSTAALHAASIRGFSLKNLVLRSFKYGVKFGALYNVGVHSLHMENVVAEHCDWGYWTENCMQPMFGHLYYGMCKSGGFFHAGSMDALWHFGNGIIQHVYGQNSGGLSTAQTKGVVITARGSTSELNNIDCHNLQANGMSQAVYTQASAPVFTAGSANIAITSNIDRFPVDSVVSFGSAIGNIDSNNLYWVQSRVDNGDGTGSIQIALFKRAPAGSIVTPSTSGSSAITVYYPLIEIGGEGSGGNQITFSRFPLIDCEAASGVGVAVQRILGCYIEFSITSGGTGNIPVMVANSSQLNTIASRRQLSNAFINVSGIDMLGFVPTSYFGGSNALKWRHQGLLGDGTVHRMFLTSDRRDQENMSGADGDIFGADSSGFPAVGFGRPVRQFHGRLSSASTVTKYSGGLITYSGAPGGSLTLPAITANMAGLSLEVMNPTSGAITLNSSSSQTFNGTASTSYSLAANTLAQLRACTADGTTFFWAAK